MEIDPDVVIKSCLYCGQPKENPKPIGPIRLPFATLQGIAEDQPGSLASVQILVACPECKQVIAYRAGNLQPHVPGTPDLRTIPPGKFPAQVSRSCGTKGCEARITIHTTVSADTTPAELQRLASLWTFPAAVLCPMGHPVGPGAPQDYLIELLGNSREHLQ
jgi:hypothetical protein